MEEIEKATAASSRGRGAGMFKENMTKDAAPRRGRYLQNT